MNKEVIYLEPEDDITDILTKLQRAEQKLVALVPPKKATILRSAVNMKLVARAAKECKKIVVIVTADPAIAKLAMTAQIPVAKTLQSRPVVPTKESIAAAAANEQIIDEDLTDRDEERSVKGAALQKDSAKMPAEASKSSSEKTSEKSAETLVLDEESLENGSKGDKNSAEKDKKAKNGKKVPDMARYRKWIILGIATALILVVVGVWAFVFAPAVNITVAMSTSANNFAEEVSFTTDANTARPSEGVFYAEKQTYERSLSEEFEATGKEDRGERASGTITVSVSFTPSAVSNGFGDVLPKGTKLTATNAEGQGVTFITTQASGISWNGEFSDMKGFQGCTGMNSNCTYSKSIEVIAEEAGPKYNIGRGRDWNVVSAANPKVIITNTSAFTGGTTNDVTVVTQSNVDSVRDKLLSNNQVEGREILMAQINKEQVVAIEASFASEAVDVTSSPEVDAEVDSNATPKLTMKAVYSVYTVSKDQIEEYVRARMSLASDQRVYSVGDPFFDRFTSIEETARIKTVVKTGPTVTEEEIVEKAAGRKIGEVQSILRSINGVSNVNITPSFFWVRSVPAATEKITVELTVEDN